MLRLLKRLNFYKAHRSEKRGVLWLASYPVRCDWPDTSSVRRKCYAPYGIVMAFPGTMRLKQLKPIINEAFVASSEDIITGYNDLYCLFTRRVASRCVNITMSALVIGEKCQTKSTTLHCSKLTFESSEAETYLQAVSQKHQTVLAKLELLHFIETAFVQPAL